ncbi:MAG: two-component system response regulator, partial [Deltaproteobacteria bacterium]
MDRPMTPSSTATDGLPAKETAAGTECPGRILIVDDRPDKLLTMEAALAPLQHEIVKAGSGRDALRCLLRHDFAVILLDLNMPGMDGFETARLIRRRRRNRDTPIIFITSYGDEIHALHGYSLGAVDFIVSPFVPKVLRSKVGVFLEL